MFIKMPKCLWPMCHSGRNVIQPPIYIFRQTSKFTDFYTSKKIRWQIRKYKSTFIWKFIIIYLVFSWWITRKPKPHYVWKTVWTAVIWLGDEKNMRLLKDFHVQAIFDFYLKSSVIYSNFSKYTQIWIYWITLKNIFAKISDWIKCERNNSFCRFQGYARNSLVSQMIYDWGLEFKLRNTKLSWLDSRLTLK